MDGYRVCHLFDQEINLESRYYRSIGEQHDRDRFPVIFCLIDAPSDLAAAASRLQSRVVTLDVATRWLYPLAILRLVRLLRQERIAILHGHFFYPTLLGLIAARLAGVRYVFTRHHSDHNIRIGKRWHTRVDALCARGADRVIAVSQETRRIMVEVENVPESRIRVVYNGMDPLTVPTPDEVARLRQELGLAGEPVCLMIARLHEEKGHRYLFEAIPKVVARVGRITVLLAGYGVERERLEAQVRAAGLSDTVRFIGFRREIPALIALSTVVVLPSLAESFGFALLEAMSLGRPVVAARTGGIPEVVLEGETGLLVPQRDSDALADALIRVIEDPDLAARLGERGRQHASRFTFDRMIRGYEAVYAEIFDKCAEEGAAWT